MSINMNRLLIPLLLLTLPSYSQVCYETDIRSKATIYVYVTKHKSQADDVIYYANYKYESDRFIRDRQDPDEFGPIYWTNFLKEIDKDNPDEYVVYFVKYKWRADRVWYIKKNAIHSYIHKNY
jgi:hypothetical protein